MTIEIVSLEGIDFTPNTKKAEIIQNVRTIVTTAKGSVPLDRDFGIDTSIIDLPINKVKSLLITNIMQAVAKYESRAKVTRVDFDIKSDGVVTPRLKVAIVDE